jgi:hypothetical protein
MRIGGGLGVEQCVEHDAGQRPERVEHGPERVEQRPELGAERLPAAGTPAADGQETPEVRAAAALPARSEGDPVPET